MKINTSNFGEIEINEENILTFEEGLPGFEGIKKFVVLAGEENNPFGWLQAVGFESPAFAIISPFEIRDDYEAEIDQTTEEMLDIKDPADVALYCIAVIPEDISQMTANLKAPIVINMKNKRGRQMIMDNSPYETKQNILLEILKLGFAKGQEAK